MRFLKKQYSSSSRCITKQRYKISFRLKSLIIAITLLWVLLACNLPTITINKTIESTLENDIRQEELTSPSNTNTPDSQASLLTPTAIISAEISNNENLNDFSILGLNQENILVYLQEDGALIFQRSDGTINKVKTAISLNYLGLPEIPRGLISFPAGKVAYMVTNSDITGLVRTDANGVIEQITAPDVPGELISALSSPDGTLIAWLFDISENISQSNTEECDETEGCTGYFYQLILTDSQGSNANTILQYIGGLESTIPKLNLLSWKSNSSSIFLRWEINIPTAFYPSVGGGIIEVSIPGGSIKVWKEDWQTDSIIDFNGTMIATANDYDHGFALRLADEKADIFTIPVQSNHLINQMSFSPSGDQLVWIDLGWDDNMVITEISLKTLSIQDQEIRNIFSFDINEEENNPPDLPYTGTWLTDELLSIDFSTGSQVIDIKTGKWVSSLVTPDTQQSTILIGNILPVLQTDVPLTKDGPWLVFRTENGFLWSVNQDGTGLKQLTNIPMIAPSDLNAAVSPDGNTLAFISSTNPERKQNLTLNLLTLPDGNVESITRLTSPETEPDFSLWEDQEALPIGDKTYEAVRAIEIDNSLAWSPDGKYIAFVGVQNGPTSDLYIFSLIDRTITRLSSGPSQAYNPSWSPDGRNIVHFGASTFGSGAGFEMVGVWISSPDNSGTKELYDPDRTGKGERIVGWLDNETFAVYSVSDCPGRDLRLVNINTGLIKMLYNDCFWQAIITQDGTLAVVNDEDMVDQPGLYILPPHQSDLIYISEGTGQDIQYSPEADSFLVLSKKPQQIIQSFTRNGSPASYHEIGDFPAVSSDGSFWAWNETGGSNKLLLRSIDNDYIIPLTSHAGYYPTWNGTDETKHILYFFSSIKNDNNIFTLYMAAAPDFNPRPIRENLSPAVSPIWMQLKKSQNQ